MREAPGIRTYHPPMPIDPPIPFPEIRPGEALKVSATLFQTFERCPEQAAGRLRGVYGPESRASFVGGLAHRVFARHLTGGPIGAEDFAKLRRETATTTLFTFDAQYNDGYQLYGMKVDVVPWMRGLLVMP